MSDESSIQKLKKTAWSCATGLTMAAASAVGPGTMTAVDAVRRNAVAAVGAVGAGTMAAAKTVGVNSVAAVYGRGGDGGKVGSGGFNGGEIGDGGLLKKVGKATLYTAGASVIILGGVAFGLPMIGFAAGGVGAGTLAAAYQGAYLGGTIASGSAFATLQSVGAGGLAASTKAGIVGITGAASLIKTFQEKSKL